LLSFIFFLIVRLLPISTLFPYTTLFRSSSPKTAPPITSGEPVLLFFLISKLPRAGLSPWHTPPPNLLWPPLLAGSPRWWRTAARSEEHTSELQSLAYLVCRLLLEKKKKN